MNAKQASTLATNIQARLKSWEVGQPTPGEMLGAVNQWRREFETAGGKSADRLTDAAALLDVTADDLAAQGSFRFGGGTAKATKTSPVVLEAIQDMIRSSETTLKQYESKQISIRQYNDDLGRMRNYWSRMLEPLPDVQKAGGAYVTQALSRRGLPAQVLPVIAMALRKVQRELQTGKSAKAYTSPTAAAQEALAEVAAMLTEAFVTEPEPTLRDERREQSVKALGFAGVPTRKAAKADFDPANWVRKITGLISAARQPRYTDTEYAIQLCAQFGAELRQQSPQAARQVILAGQELKAGLKLSKDGDKIRAWAHLGNAMEALKNAKSLVASGKAAKAGSAPAIAKAQRLQQLLATWRDNDFDPAQGKQALAIAQEMARSHYPDVARRAEEIVQALPMMIRDAEHYAQREGFPPRASSVQGLATGAASYIRVSLTNRAGE